MESDSESSESNYNERMTTAAYVFLSRLKAQGKSQKKIEAQTKLRQKTISNILKGAGAGTRTIDTLAKAVQMSPEAFVQKYADNQEAEPVGRWKPLVRRLSEMMDAELGRDYVDEIERLARVGLLPQGRDCLATLAESGECVQNQTLGEIQPSKAKKSTH